MTPAASPVAARETLLIGVVLVLGLAGAPQPIVNDVDASWQIMLAKAAIEGLAHGRDIVFSYGPLGVLENTHQLPDLLPQQLIWQIGTRSLAALIMTGFLRDLGRRLIWLAVGLAIVLLHSSRTTLVLNDPFYYVIILLSGLMLIRESVDWKRLVAASILLGLLALVKFNLTMLTGAIVALAAGCLCWRRSWLPAGVVVAGFGLTVAVGWLGSGHPAIAISQYLTGSWHLASAYLWAMMFPAHPVKLAFGVVLVAAAAGMVAASRPAAASRHATWGTAVLMLATVGIMAWKHSFTRADPVHMPGIFTCLLFVFLLWPALQPLVGRADVPGVRRAALALGSLALAGAVLAAREIAPSAPRRALQNLRGNLTLLIAPRQHLRDFAGETTRRCGALDLPATRAVVGRARVDVHGNYPLVALANELDFRPRPTLQSYSAFSPQLAARNARAVQEADPEFVLMHAAPIGRHLPGFEDGIALALVLENFTPVLFENGWILHRRSARTGSRLPGTSTPDQIHLLHWGEPQSLPKEPQRSIWASVEINPTTLGRIISFLYQPPLVGIELALEDGTTRGFDLPPLMARTPFLLSPSLCDDVALQRWGASGGPLPQVRSVRIVPGGRIAKWCYQPDIHLSLRIRPSF